MSRHARIDRPQTADPSPVLPPARTGGQALDSPTNARMSSQFGHDFSSVRIHTDARAEESADAFGAAAYALGSDVVFGAGQFQPGSPQTERTLAHELTHVVQQSRFGPGDPARASDRGDASEREAETTAARVTAGLPVAVRSAPGAAVARMPLDAPVIGSLDSPMPGFLAPTMPDFPVPPASATALDAFAPGPLDSSMLGFPAPPAAAMALPNGPVQMGRQYPQNGGGPYAYDNSDRFGALGVPGHDFGLGVGVSGSRASTNVGGTGMTGSIGGDFGMGLRGNAGGWNAGNVDNPTENRYGLRLNGMGVPGVIPGATATGSLGDGHGRSVGFDAQGMTYGAEASAGGDGMTLGGGFTLGAAAVSANNGTEAVRAGLSAGPSLAGRLHWGMGAGGHRNYGFGADIGPVSFDATSNDPLRSVLLGGRFLPEGNMTEGAAGLVGDAYNGVTGAASSVYNAGSQVVSDAYHDPAGTATRAYNGVTGAASSVYNTGSQVVSDAYHDPAGTASRAYNGVEGAASSVYNAGSEAVSHLWNSLPSL